MAQYFRNTNTGQMFQVDGNAGTVTIVSSIPQGVSVSQGAFTPQSIADQYGYKVVGTSVGSAPNPVTGSISYGATNQQPTQQEYSVQYGADLGSMETAYANLAKNAKTGGDYQNLGLLKQKIDAERSRQQAIVSKAQEIMSGGGGSVAINDYYASLPSADQPLVKNIFGTNIIPGYKPATGNVKQTIVTPEGIRTETQTGAPDTTGMFDTLIKGNPFLSQLLSDPKMREQYDALDPDLKGIFLQTANTLGKAVESGKIINPNIELTPAENQKLLDQASTELEPYYKEKLGLLRNEIETSTSRLMEDYNKGVARADEPFKEKLAGEAEAEAQAGTTFSSARGTRQARTINVQQQALDDALTAATRGAQDTATAFEKQAGTAGLRSLNVPSISGFTASQTGITQGASRSLYAPLGNIALGEVGKEKATALAGRRSELETAFRSNRLLDLSKLS